MKARVLMDFSFNINEQLLNLEVYHLDAAILTHDHADHVSGIDELRNIVYIYGKPLNVFILESIVQLIFKRYKYLFEGGTLKMNIVSELQEIKINNTIFHLFPQIHGAIKSLSIRAEEFVYSCDISSIPDKSGK